MRKVTIIALAIAAVVMDSWAAGNTDVLYLKNGSVIRGNIELVEPGGMVKIRTADGSLFVLQMSEVEKIESATEDYIEGSKRRVVQRDAQSLARD